MIFMEKLITKYPALEVCKESIKSALKLIIDTYKSGGKVLVCGNGGSAADAGADSAAPGADRR